MNSIDMPCFGLELGEQLEDLRLHGHVERRRRLVGDQQFRLVGERHGDHHALALAAGELVRIGAEPLLRLADADLVEQLQRARARRRSPMPRCSVEDLADLLLDRVQRVERGHRLLEDHGDLVAAHLAAAASRRREQILALEEDLAGRDGCAAG